MEDEDETQITSFYELVSNPFKVGDEILLDVENLYPVEYNKFEPEVQANLRKKNSELETKFKRKKVKLVREGKYVKFTTLSEPKITIEYHCVYSEE